QKTDAPTGLERPGEDEQSESQDAGVAEPTYNEAFELLARFIEKLMSGFAALIVPQLITAVEELHFPIEILRRCDRILEDEKRGSGVLGVMFLIGKTQRVAGDA